MDVIRKSSIDNLTKFIDDIQAVLLEDEIYNFSVDYAKTNNVDEIVMDI